MKQTIKLTHRIATEIDKPALIKLMQESIEENMKAFLSNAEIEAAKETMGVDKTLLEDRTYFIIETLHQDQTVMVGCGGWGKRKTLYGGDHTVGRDDSLSDPQTEPARIRAMYTHPDWGRQGIGSYLINLGEDSARKAGFKTIELGATTVGEPLYISRGYKAVERTAILADNGVDSIIIRMVKSLV